VTTRSDKRIFSISVLDTDIFNTCNIPIFGYPYNNFILPMYLPASNIGILVDYDYDQILSYHYLDIGASQTRPKRDEKRRKVA
jgi:hypothetical protein